MNPPCMFPMCVVPETPRKPGDGRDRRWLGRRISGRPDVIIATLYAPAPVVVRERRGLYVEPEDTADNVSDGNSSTPPHRPLLRHVHITTPLIYDTTQLKCHFAVRCYAVVRCLSRSCMSRLLSLSLRSTILVFAYKTLWQYSDGDSLKWGKNRDFRPISGFGIDDCWTVSSTF